MSDIEAYIRLCNIIEGKCVFFAVVTDNRDRRHFSIIFQYAGKLFFTVLG